MKRFFWCVILGISLCGCSKESSPTAAQHMTNAVATVAPDAKPLVGVVHPELTAALKSFAQEKSRLPESLLELKRAKLDSMPRPPEGYVFAIDPATIEVKLVKQ